jgi:hypothetical protein
MKSQWILALLAATLALVVARAANAQGAPVYIGPGAPPQFEPPGYVRAEPLPDDVLLPREIVGILRSTGFSPLSAPIRRGRFYFVAALHPDGEDGQVTMDAITGRFIRFVPAELIGRSMASYPPPPYAPPRRGVLRPPMPLPGVAARAPAPTPVPAARPSQANPQTANAATTNQPAQTPAAKPADSKTASVNAGAKSADPVEIKPSFSKPAGGPALLPIKPMPPAQGFE